MPFCASCGNRAEDEDVFCQQCGSKIERQILQKTTQGPNFCSKCGKGINGKYFQAMGAYYHDTCFTCVQVYIYFYQLIIKCGTMLGSNFYEQNGKYYCEHDYNRVFGSTCARLYLALKSDCIDVVKQLLVQ